MKVLIVDDSHLALKVAKVRLAKEDVDIICEDGGQAGLKAAKSAKPDLILLDVDMPDISGFDVCRILKADPETSMIPVIFLSGSGKTKDKIRGLDLGAIDYVTKPFDAFELQARVRAALRTKRLQDLLIRSAQVDPLTELSNRGALTDHLRREWTRRQRHGGSIAFIMCDLDHFKAINDTHGHNVGDTMLRKVAKAITSCCRESDFAARYGGEEFSIVVPEQDVEGAASLAERCREAIEQICMEVGTETIRITASFGVSDAEGSSSEKELICHADEALYRAKSAGRNRVELATSASESLVPKAVSNVE